MVSHSKVESNTSYQHKPTEDRRGRVHTSGGTKGRGSNAPSNKGRGSNAPLTKGRGSNAPSQNFDWNEDVDKDERDGDNELSTNGGRVGNSKRDRSQSNSTEERVPVKRGARGVKDLRTDLDPLDKVKVTTPGIVKISPKSGNVQSVQEVTLTGIGRQHASAVGLLFIYPGAPGPPLLSLTVSLEGVVTTLMAGEVNAAIVSDGEGGSEDPAKYGHSTYKQYKIKL